MTSDATEPTDANGRRSDGKFGPGNKFARGNPVARHVQKLRQAFVSCITEGDVLEIVAKLIELAKSGDVNAANLVLTRALGKPSTADVTMPLDDALPILEASQIIDIDDAREFVAMQYPERSVEMLEKTAQLALRLSKLTPEQQRDFAMKMRDRQASRLTDTSQTVVEDVAA